MKVNEINELLNLLTDENVKYFIKSIKNKNIKTEIKENILNDLFKLLLYSKSKKDKTRIEKYIKKFNNLKIQEKIEKNNELNDIEKQLYSNY